MGARNYEVRSIRLAQLQDGCHVRWFIPASERPRHVHDEQDDVQRCTATSFIARQLLDLVVIVGAQWYPVDGRQLWVLRHTEEEARDVLVRFVAAEARSI